jgi:hypothetical protein
MGDTLYRILDAITKALTFAALAGAAIIIVTAWGFL